MHAGDMISRLKIDDLLRMLDTKFFGNAFRKDFFMLGLPDKEREYFLRTEDPVRFGSFGLAIQRITKEEIPGAFAEVGVYRGASCTVIHALAPGRKLYLFDTFEGFPEKDLKGWEHKGGVHWSKETFTTSVDFVRKRLGDTRNVEFRKGYFPDTAKGLENERFAFVNLDVDLYNPTLAGLEFFYPRLSRGGYIFVHDYNNPAADRGVSKSLGLFFKDKVEQMVELPDVGGSVVIRKS